MPKVACSSTTCSEAAIDIDIDMIMDLFGVRVGFADVGTTVSITVGGVGSSEVGTTVVGSSDVDIEAG